VGTEVKKGQPLCVLLHNQPVGELDAVAAGAFGFGAVKEPRPLVIDRIA
jgi:hypothetical protein